MITCLIVEDEPLASEVLKDYISKLPFLKLRGVCTDSVAAMEVLTREKIDLMFLDIHLPGLKGLDFLKAIPHPPKTILTTAYHAYALQGYDLNVLDYLLKPIAFDRFLLAVNKFSRIPETVHGPEPTTLTIQSDKRKIVISLSDIIYLESQQEYILIHTLEQDFTTKYGLGKMEEELDPALFLRVHRSFIVALKKIKSFNGQEIEVPGKKIPIGGHYKVIVAQKLASIFQGR